MCLVLIINVYVENNATVRGLSAQNKAVVISDNSCPPELVPPSKRTSCDLWSLCDSGNSKNDEIFEKLKEKHPDMSNPKLRL